MIAFLDITPSANDLDLKVSESCWANVNDRRLRWEIESLTEQLGSD